MSPVVGNSPTMMELAHKWWDLMILHLKELEKLQVPPPKGLKGK